MQTSKFISIVSDILEREFFIKINEIKIDIDEENKKVKITIEGEENETH